MSGLRFAVRVGRLNGQTAMPDFLSAQSGKNSAMPLKLRLSPTMEARRDDSRCTEGCADFGNEGR